MYWISATLVAALGLWVSHLLEEQQAWMNARYSLYQWIQRLTLFGRDPVVRSTVLVLIGDEEYWKGPLARRVPIKRDYLADLVRQVDLAEPAVIAIDFNLRSPVPGGSEHPAYQEETRKFLETVNEVATRRPVVLPRTIGYETGYMFDGDIHDGFPWSSPSHLKFGYIALPFDKRRIPVSLNLKDGSRIDSFPLAIALAFHARSVQVHHRTGALPFGSYLPLDQFEQHRASEVLAFDVKVLKEYLGRKIVIIGGAWHATAYARGPQIDGYLTPVGRMPGAFIHANYVEALLDRRAASPVSERVAATIELSLILAAMVVFAVQNAWYWRLLAVVAVCVTPFVLSYFFLQNVGLYFDAVVPIVMVGAHSILDEAREWRIRRHVEQ